MACEFVCDWCGKQEPGYWNGSYWIKPSSWFLRADEDGPQLACSRECIEKIAEKSGKTNAILPF